MTGDSLQRPALQRTGWTVARHSIAASFLYRVSLAKDGPTTRSQSSWHFDSGGVIPRLFGGGIFNVCSRLPILNVAGTAGVRGRQGTAVPGCAGNDRESI